MKGKPFKFRVGDRVVVHNHTYPRRAPTAIGTVVSRKRILFHTMWKQPPTNEYGVRYLGDVAAQLHLEGYLMHTAAGELAIPCRTVDDESDAGPTVSLRWENDRFISV